MNTSKLIITFFLFLTSLLFHANAVLVEDYCVADLTLPRGPTGYSCKDPSTVTIDDFVFTGFREAGSTDNVFKAGVIPAFVEQYNGLNGLGLSMGRLDLEVGGVIPLHTHRTSEIEIVAKGRVLAGFIDTNNTAYYKTLEVGDVIIFPESLLHFQVNIGSTPALIFATLNSAKPGVQLIDTALFAGNFPPELVEKTMLLDREQIEKLRNVDYGDFAPMQFEKTIYAL